MEHKDYLSLAQAAQLLGVHKETLRKWDREGKIISQRHPFNNYRFFKREDLEPLMGFGSLKNKVE